MGGRALAPLGTAPTKNIISKPVNGEKCNAILNDAARRVATVFEKWNCLIENSLPWEGESPTIRLTHTGALPRSPFWNTEV